MLVYICLSTDREVGREMHVSVHSQIHVYFNIMLAGSLFQLNKTVNQQAASICQE